VLVAQPISPEGNVGSGIANHSALVTAMDSTFRDSVAVLEGLLDEQAPMLAEIFYRQLQGFQDPFGDGRRILTLELLRKLVDQSQARNPALDHGDFVAWLLDNVALLPPPINVDYGQFKHKGIFAPHLVCFALAFTVHFPDAALLKPFTLLVIRSGWWAGDENCVDDIFRALNDDAEVCRIAAESIPDPPSEQALFAAGQLLYHFKYGTDWGLREFVKSEYEKAARTLKSPGDIQEAKSRLSSGLKPWISRV
jgi:hypothetical protein